MSAVAEQTSGWIGGVLRRAASHSVIYGLSVGLLPLTSLLLLPLYTRHLSGEVFGLLSLMLVTSGILSFCFDLGMVNALFRRYFEHGEERSADRRRVLSTAWVFLAGHAACWSALLAVAAPWLPPVQGVRPAPEIVRMMLLGTWLSSCADVPLSALRIQGRALTFAAVALLRGASSIALTWWLVAVADRGLVGVFESQALVATVTLAVAAMLTWREFAFTWSWHELQAMLRFGLPFLPALCFTWIIDFSDRYFLGVLAGLKEVGVYTVAYKVGQGVLLAIRAFMVAWVPLLFSIARHQDAPRAFATVLRYYFFGVTLLALAAAVWAPELVKLLSTPAYGRGATIVPLIAAAYLAYALYSFMLSGLLVTRDVWVQPVTLAAAAVVNVSLNWWWIPRWGMWGAGWATLAAYALAAALTWRASQRRYPIPVAPGRLAAMVGLAVGVGALAHWIPLGSAGKAVWIAAYLAAACLLRLIAPTELAQVSGLPAAGPMVAVAK